MARQVAFKGRERELALLDRLWRKDEATLLILYGRRRVGKTRLLTHWRGQHAAQALYWVAEPMSALDQLRSFSQALYNFSQPHAPVPMDISYSNWEQAFWHVAELSKNQRMALFIDEFTYLLEVEPSIVGTLQKAWDHWLKESNLMLTLSGSQMGLMQNQVLSYEAPLYGRATAHLKLPPMAYGVSGEFFPNYSAADRVTIYAVFGGVPAYWERLDPSVSVMENIQEQLLTSNSFMQEEPLWLLQDFVTDPYNYVGIMQAIARGDRTSARICSRTGLPKGHVSRYLSILRETSFVERAIPITDLPSSRKSRYFVTDPYLRFYYHFLSAYKTQLAIGGQQEAFENMERNLPAFLEDNTWRELCHEWLLRASVNGELPFKVRRVGGAWVGATSVDVVGINEEACEIVLGTCLWRDRPADLGDMQALVAKTASVVPSKGNWSVGYLGFSSSGWTEGAQSYARGLTRSGVFGQNWKVDWSKLLDLDMVDDDLVRLSKGDGSLDPEQEIEEIAQQIETS
ncbi:MAG: ATP-binding protein [Candidatus Promineifilaceae bacterium]